MIPCKNCNGEGLVGQGPEPWLKHGKIVTCPKCAGTGKVADESVNGDETSPAATTGEQKPEATVDNSNSPKGEGSPESSGGEVSPGTTPVQG